jgi:uncharacterized membrane protein YhaH (DUF805 family)
MSTPDESLQSGGDKITSVDNVPLTSGKQPTSAAGELNEEEVEQRDNRPFVIRHITFFVKLYGVLTLAGMWACTVIAIQRHADGDYSPWYCLAATIVVTLLELVWYFNTCAICQDKGGCCCTCWRVLMWVDNWKKGLFYVILAVPSFPRGVILPIICGVILSVLGLMYIAKSFTDCRCFGGKKYVRRPPAGAT